MAKKRASTDMFKLQIQPIFWKISIFFVHGISNKVNQVKTNQFIIEYIKGYIVNKLYLNPHKKPPINGC